MRDLRREAPILGMGLAAIVGLLCADLGGVLAASVLTAGFMAGEMWTPRPPTRIRGALLAAAFAGLWNATDDAPASPVVMTAAGFVALDGTLETARTSARSGSSRFLALSDGRRVRLALPPGSEVRLPSGPFRATGTAWSSGAHGTLYASPATLDFDRPTWSPWQLKAGVRRHVATALRRCSSRVRGFASRILFGNGDLVQSDEEAHRATGLAHLLAISGLHAVFVATLIHALLCFILPWRLPRLIALAAALVTYAWLCDARPPVVRAVVAYLLWTISRTRGRRSGLASILTVSALVSFFVCGERLGSISLQLSFAAVVGIAALGMPTTRDSPTRAVVIALRVSFAAWLATAPFALDAFANAGPWGIVLTPLAVPGVFVTLALTIATTLVEPIVPTILHMWFSAALDVCATVQLDFIAWTDRLPGAPLLATALPPRGVGPWIFALGAACAWLLESRRTFTLACALAILPYFVETRRPHAEELRVLPVGHGQCVVARHASGKLLVIDCGDRVDGALATRQLTTYLRTTGRNRIDHLVLTHGDADHIAGIEALLGIVHVAHVCVPENPKLAAIQARLQRARIRCHLVTPGARVELEPGFFVTLPLVHGDLTSSNDGGLVIDWRTSGPRILVFGDQEAAGCAAAREAIAAEPPIDALVVPHHAAVQRQLPLLLDALNPARTVASTSSRKGLAAEWDDPYLRVFRPLTTGASGTLVLRVLGDGLATSSGR